MSHCFSLLTLFTIWSSLIQVRLDLLLWLQKGISVHGQHGRHTENLCSCLCVHSCPSTMLCKVFSLFQSPNQVFPSARQNKVWSCFSFLLVIETVWRFSFFGSCHCGWAAGIKGVVRFPYSVFLIEEHIIYFERGNYVNSFVFVCQSGLYRKST